MLRSEATPEVRLWNEAGLIKCFQTKIAKRTDPVSFT